MKLFKKTALLFLAAASIASNLSAYFYRAEVWKKGNEHVVLFYEYHNLTLSQTLHQFMQHRSIELEPSEVENLTKEYNEKQQIIDITQWAQQINAHMHIEISTYNIEYVQKTMRDEPKTFMCALENSANSALPFVAASLCINKNILYTGVDLRNDLGIDKKTTDKNAFIEIGANMDLLCSLYDQVAQNVQGYHDGPIATEFYNENLREIKENPLFGPIRQLVEKYRLYKEEESYEENEEEEQLSEKEEYLFLGLAAIGKHLYTSFKKIQNEHSTIMKTIRNKLIGEISSNFVDIETVHQLRNRQGNQFICLGGDHAEKIATEFLPNDGYRLIGQQESKLMLYNTPIETPFDINEFFASVLPPHAFTSEEKEGEIQHHTALLNQNRNDKKRKRTKEETNQFDAYNEDQPSAKRRRL